MLLHICCQFTQSCIAVQYLALILLLQQRMVRMLTVDIDQKIAGLAQLLNIGRHAIDKGTGTAVGVDDATQQQHSVLCLQFAFLQPVLQIRQTVNFKAGDNLGALTAAARDTALASGPKRQGQRVDQY